MLLYWYDRSLPLYFLYRYIIKRPFQSTTDDDNDPSIQPPPKKRSRGQNKYRPLIKIPFSSQLCPTFHIGSHKKCNYGEKCRYLHDILQYIQLKPPDIGSSCYTYDTYGYCPSGVACRYGNSHIDQKEGINIIDKDKYKPDQVSTKVMNTIPRTLQEQLRKKKIPFPRTDLFLKTISTIKPSTITAIPMATTVTTIPHDDIPLDSECSSNVCSKDDSQLEEKLEDAVVMIEKDNVILDKVPKQIDNEGSTHIDRDGLDLDVEGVASNQLSHPLGPVTDEDIIKLRPSEKKRIDFKDKLYLAPLTTVSIIITINYYYYYYY